MFDQIMLLGKKVSIPDILQQWYEFVEYAKKTVSFRRSKIFTVTGNKGWSDVLLMIRYKK